MFFLCSGSPSDWTLPFTDEDLYPNHFFRLAGTSASSVYDDESPNIDMFDNPFIPTHPIAYVPGDFPGEHVSPEGIKTTTRMNPSVWRVLPEEEPQFVRPEDLFEPLKVTRPDSPQTSDSSDSDHCTSFRRPTLDEFMSNMEYYRNSLETTFTGRKNVQRIRSKSLKTGGAKLTNAEKRSYACPFPDCSHACSSRSDLERHLLCKEHKEPSVACPKQCGAMYTRKDSAKRHGKLCSYGTRKSHLK